MSSAPNDRDSEVFGVIEALRASDLPLAFMRANQCLHQGLQHPALYSARGIYLQMEGRYAEALANFERGRDFAVHDPVLLLAIGSCLSNLHRLPEALEAAGRAIALRPGFAEAYNLKGQVASSLGQTAIAERSFQRALEIQPQNANALAALASISTRRGDSALARQYATRALAIEPQNPTATVSLAVAEISEGCGGAAEQRLRALIDDPTSPARARAMAYGVLGDALDAQDRIAEAFASYSTSRALLRDIYAPQLANGRVVDTARSLNRYFLRANATLWNQSSPNSKRTDEPLEHVFLIGFMRSGTTLLGQILSGHPLVLTLDERDFLTEANSTYLRSVAGLDRLAGLTNAELMYWRDRYWAQVHGTGLEVGGKIFIDKLPFNTARLPLIARLFPFAKILFAVRDPRDTVFSSFRRHFEMNPTMYEFLSLEDGAHFYAALMELAEAYRRILRLDLLELRYEDVVADFDGAIRGVCGFLGIDFHPAMKQFSRFAARADIRNPSAAQVRRPLYKEGIGSWRRYAEFVNPILPILAPWTTRFGYSND